MMGLLAWTSAVTILTVRLVKASLTPPSAVFIWGTAWIVFVVTIGSALISGVW